MKPRERLEKIEDKNLASYATRSSNSIGRTLHGQEEDDYRTCFQRDRDRILYSKYFKDLQYKTQVFLISEGDFYRTRLTHTLEVSQHARTLARALKLNEDLCEAISYAHDLGHPPFGHIGEETLNEILKDDGGFEHNFQSLRIVDKLEKRYDKYDGLNLCFETREGIARHQTNFDNPRIPEEFRQYSRPTLEAQVVNIADPLAYCAHDLEDALNAGYLTYEDIRKYQNENALIARIIDECRRKYSNFDHFEKVIKARLLVRDLIETTNIMVIKQTENNIREFKIEAVEDVRKINMDIIAAPTKDWEDFTRLQQFLFENVYRSPQVCILNEKGKWIITGIFKHLEKIPEMLPKSFRNRFEESANKSEKRRIIADYISGMTDRYAMDLYQMMFEPYEKVMFEFRE
ncbi:MAG: deoxyguanosinetriphosphate triphosphohydrolase [Candidatus Hodarchaeota archaeon]